MFVFVVNVVTRVEAEVSGDQATVERKHCPGCPEVLLKLNESAQKVEMGPRARFRSSIMGGQCLRSLRQTSALREKKIHIVAESLVRKTGCRFQGKPFRGARENVSWHLVSVCTLRVDSSN